VKIIQYHIYLEQPLLATMLHGDPNSSVSFNYVPGSQVRGLLIRRYIERNRLQATDVAGSADCQRLFFDATTRYLNAYPRTRFSQRSLPTPLALQKRRSDELAHDFVLVWNTSHSDWDAEARRNAQGDDQLNALDQPFCWQHSDGTLSLYRPQPNTISIHVLRERPKGRATLDQGAVFQYDALSPGQWFAGVILADLDSDATTIRSLLDPATAWLGRSRTAEYGRVRIEAQPEQSGIWREVGGSIPGALGMQATITLLSDTIVHNSDGNLAAMLTNEILSAYLGVQVTIDAYHSFSVSTYLGGFNRIWQMPIVQTPALQAGSVIAFTPHGLIDLPRIEQQGIGERRAEGLGRVAFDWLNEIELTANIAEIYQPANQRDTTQKLSPVAATLAQRMSKQLLATQIEQGILMFTRDNRLTNPPRNSQLARVRVLIRRAIRDGYTLKVVRDGMQAFKDVARQQYYAAQIEGKSFWDWLGELLAEPASAAQDTGLPSYEHVWGKINRQHAPWPVVAGATAQRDPQLSHATALRLIDAVLANSTRANKRSALETAIHAEEANA